ncbi:MAG: rhodanese-related sulfurtransferase [Bacteroidota bacterium]|nr:rhodanese-related sulfurtransferase [Bacteroidota bacterium]
MEKKSVYWVLAYYFYTPIFDAEEYVGYHLAYCKKLGIKGRIYIAREGINGTISGTPQQMNVYMDDLKSDPRFEGISFKVDEFDHIPFSKMHVRLKNEIVHSGLKNVNPIRLTGKHLHGEEFQALQKQEDVIVVDVRSNYETRLGKFKNAITFDMETFREFPEKVKELEKYKDKKIVTYCTGGIKCEKASAYLLEQGFKDVYQLYDGIIGYAKETGGKDFDGVLYVFDGRVTVPINEVNPEVISECKKCGVKVARSLNCANVDCNEQFTMCEACSNEMEGCCTTECMQSPGKREYNGTGFYAKPSV